MILVAILIGTLIAGIGSVLLAAALGFGLLARYTQHMLSLAAGALLATAFMHLLPEAFESQASAQQLFAALLAGLVFFFLLDKAELWHHGHEHGAGHEHDHGHDHAHDHRYPDDSERSAGTAPLASSAQASHEMGSVPPKAREATSVGAHHKSGGWAVLAGDSVHCFGDGVLIASAFMADIKLGMVASLAVLAHEVPHHMGDLVVLRRSSNNDQRTAVVKVSLAGAVTAIGGMVGYFLVEQLYGFLPFFLVLASSSFIYVALADLIPQLQKRAAVAQTIAQIGWLLAGIALVTVIGQWAH